MHFLQYFLCTFYKKFYLTLLEYPQPAGGKAAREISSFPGTAAAFPQLNLKIIGVLSHCTVRNRGDRLQVIRHLLLRQD